MTDVTGAKKATGEKFMKKAEREACWGARDKYWECLKANNDENSKCLNFRQFYTEACPPTWVTHFVRKYHYERFKENAAKQGYANLDAEFTKQKQWFKFFVST